MFGTKATMVKLAVFCGLVGFLGTADQASAQCYSRGGYQVGGNGGGWYPAARQSSHYGSYSHAAPRRSVYVDRPVYVERNYYRQPTRRVTYYRSSPRVTYSARRYPSYSYGGQRVHGHRGSRHGHRRSRGVSFGVRW